MNPFVRIISMIGLTFVLTGCSLSLAGNRQAALQVTSAPKATVFINGQHVGQTPFFDDKLKAGEYTLKLVPEATPDVLPSWETKVKLTPQILTVVNRQIGSSDTQSSGEILTLQPLSSKTKTSLTVISLPDSAIVKLNGQPKGFTPVEIDEIAPGEHTLVLAAAGYQERDLKVKVATGHKLTVSVQLAQQAAIQEPLEEETIQETEATETEAETQPGQIASASAQAKKAPYIEILDNPLGFLRVRSQSSTQGDELARAVPGQQLPFLNETDNGWYKVSWATGKTGWVARGGDGQYAQLVK